MERAAHSAAGRAYGRSVRHWRRAPARTKISGTCIRSILLFPFPSGRRQRSHTVRGRNAGAAAWCRSHGSRKEHQGTRSRAGRRLAPRLAARRVPDEPLPGKEAAREAPGRMPPGEQLSEGTHVVVPSPRLPTHAASLPRSYPPGPTSFTASYGACSRRRSANCTRRVSDTTSACCHSYIGQLHAV